MNKDILKGNWMQIRGSVKNMWGKLTDDDIDQINGNRDQLVGALEKRYGYSREQAEAQVDRFNRDLENRIDPNHPYSHDR